MAADTVTVHLPDGLYRRLERLADLTKQPLEGLIVRTLAANLPPLPDDLPLTTSDALIRLEALTDDELWHQVNAVLSDDHYAQLTELREKRREGTLSANEKIALDHLLQEADLLTLQKAYSAVLLKWRGHRFPPTTFRSEASA